MVISNPALFIVPTNACFPALCSRFLARSLVLMGQFPYTIGGCVAGAFSNIWMVLLMRALVGFGIGIIIYRYPLDCSPSITLPNGYTGLWGCPPL